MADINVISPQGVPGTIPSEQLSDALGQNFTLPPKQITAADLTPDGKEVKVFNPEGVPGTIPVHQATDALSALGGFKLASTTNPLEMAAHSTRVNTAYAGYQTMGDFFGDKDSPFVKSHETDDLVGKDGSVHLKDSQGNPIDVGVKLAPQLLASGQVSFRDPNGQALYEAALKATSELETGGSAFGTGYLPGGHAVSRALEMGSPFSSNVTHAKYLATEVLKMTKYADTAQKAEIAGAILPIVATRGVGLLGEGALAVRAGKATELAIKGEEAVSASKAALAWTAGRAVEGLVITSPQIIAQAAIDKEPKLALETAALGIGLGIGFGGLGKLVEGAGAGLSKLKPVVVDAALKEAGATEEVLSKLGTVEQRESFLKNLQEMGAKEAGSAEKMSVVLQKIAEGDSLAPTIAKLDPYLAKELKLGDQLQTSIGEISNKMGIVNKEIEPVANQISKDLSKLSDESGHLSLTDLQKFVSNLGKEITYGQEGNAINSFKQAIQGEGLKTLLTVGDEAATKADAKIASEWINNKASVEIAKQMHTNIVSEGLKEAFSPSFKLLKTLVTSRGAHMISGALGVSHGLPGFAMSQVIHSGLERAANFIEHYASNPENASKMGGWLSKKASSPYAASYLALDSLHSFQQKLEQVPEFLKLMTIKGATTFATKDSPIKQILGSQANGLSKDQQFAKLSSNLSMMVGNPELREQHLNNITAPFAKNHPEFADGLKQEYDNKIQYLHQIMPKNPNPPQPFMKDDKWKPSAAELAEFDNHLKVAQNPFVLLDKLKEGKVTAKEVATAAMLNPEIMNHMRDQIAIAAYSGKANLTYQQRLSASIVMGQAMDASLSRVQELQAVYAGAPPESMPVPPGASGGKGRKGGASHLNAEKASKSAQTMSQRLMGK